jgi:hypothetical protein
MCTVVTPDGHPVVTESLNLYLAGTLASLAKLGKHLF